MARFSRGLRAAAARDLRRIVNITPPEQQLAVVQAARQLLETVVEDPHEKGEAHEVHEGMEVRVCQLGPLRMFFQVRSADDRYVEVLGFSSA